MLQLVPDLVSFELPSARICKLCFDFFDRFTWIYNRWVYVFEVWSKEKSWHMLSDLDIWRSLITFDWSTTAR